MTEDSGDNQSVAKSSGPRNKHALVRAIAAALLVVAAVGGISLAYERGAITALLARLQALPQGSSWDWWVGALFALLGVLGALVLWKVPQWQVACVEGLDSKERFDKRNEARKTLATVLGGLAFLTGGYFTYRNFSLAQESLRVSQQGQIADRFTKAIEQLGAVDSTGKPKLDSRLAGIYSLEAIAKESESFHWPVMEVLCNYVRVNAPAVAEESPASAASVAQKKSTVKLGSIEHPPADIQAILTVLGKREHRDWESDTQRFNLSKTNLRGTDLHEAHLEKAHLAVADLRKADLDEVHLEEAHLDGANLGAVIRHEANFVITSWTSLREAHLIGAYLEQAKLESADLSKAHLEKAQLLGADLNKAQLDGANLSTARNLTQNQVESAHGNAYTILPKELCLPRKWEGVTADNPRACKQ